MFKCTRCGRTFTRKSSLLRHMKRLVHTRSNTREFPSNNNDGVAKNQFENAVDQWAHNDSYINSAENTTSSAQHESPEFNYEDNDGENDFSFGRNRAEEEDISPMFQNKHDEVDQSKRSLNSFDKIMIAAIEAIKTKFNPLKNSHNILQSKEEKDNWSNEYEQKDLPLSDNYKEASFTSKMAGLLQTALDILMIKELQNAYAMDEGEEQEDKNSFNQTKRKRPLTSSSINGEQKEDVEETKSMKKFEKEYGVRSHVGSAPTFGTGLMQPNKLKKDYIYWDDPNELVDRLRLLVASQQAGHTGHNNEIIAIIKELKEADIID